MIAAGLGCGHALAGHLAEGIALLEEAIREGLHTGGIQAHSLHIARLSEACLRAGRPDEGWQYARQALDLARQQKARRHEEQAFRQLGALHADVEQAEAYYRQALALAHGLGMRPHLAHCHLNLEKLYLKIGRQEEARAELSAAIELYRTMVFQWNHPRMAGISPHALGVWI